MVNQAKLNSHCAAPRHEHGCEVPKDCKHALDLDKKFGHDCWFSFVALELDQIDKCDTFLDLDMGSVPPEEHKLIKVHLAFDPKHDGRHKARLAANGHMNNVPLQ